MTDYATLFSIIKDVSWVGGIIIFLWFFGTALKKQNEILRENLEIRKKLSEESTQELEVIRLKHKDLEKELEITQEFLKQEKGRWQGKRLFEYKGYYPIDIATDGSNLPNPNKKTFLKAVEFFLHSKFDRLAVSDLVYLREDNLRTFGDILETREERELYEKLIEKYDLLEFRQKFENENDEIFKNYKKIVDDLGKTFENVYVEILVHNVRNPLKSIIAISGSHQVSRRKLNDPSTRFVVQFVKNQGEVLIKAMKDAEKVSYLKQFDKTRKVKATTTPLWHEKYGLIGILCININIDAVNGLDSKKQKEFFANYTMNSGLTPDFEKEDWGLK